MDTTWPVANPTFLRPAYANYEISYLRLTSKKLFALEARSKPDTLTSVETMLVDRTGDVLGTRSDPDKDISEGLGYRDINLTGVRNLTKWITRSEEWLRIQRWDGARYGRNGPIYHIERVRDVYSRRLAAWVEVALNGILQ